MADYDWFRPSAEEVRRSAEEARWREQNHVVIVNFSDSGYTHRETYGCTLCGSVLIAKKYLPVHRETCILMKPGDGKHRKST